jgi:sulfide:quinone oxidoreductase
VRENHSAGEGILRLCPAGPVLNVDPMFEASQPRPEFRVIVVGGGVAALEATLALHHLAPEQVDVTLLTSAPEFVMRPLTVAEPFAYGPAERHELAPILEELGADLLIDELDSVDAEARTVSTTGGRVLHYDALLLACGARPAVRFEHAVTVDDRKLDDLLHGMVQDIEGDYIHSIAFVAPDRMPWPLPLYELALMTAQRAWSMGIELQTTIVTPEDQPLGVFGEAASAGVRQLLRDAGIELLTASHVEIPHRRQIVINPGHRQLRVDRVVALPELYGPAIPGVPHDEYGFVIVDAYGRAPHAGPVFAAGDVANFEVKHGGIASQMADGAAQSIAALAGAPVIAHPLEPILRAKLLTGDAPRYLSARRVDGHAMESEFSETPLWEPPSKISSVYLAPYLEQRNGAAATAHSAVGG